MEHRVWAGALLLEVVLPSCNFQIASMWQALLALLPSLSFLPWSRASLNGSEIRVIVGPAQLGSGVLHLPKALCGSIALAYACILLYFAGRLAWGFGQTHSIARLATRISLTGPAASRWTECVKRLDIAPPLELAISPHVISPVMVGLWRGVVILPPAFLERVASDDLIAVLAHELAHIRRHDFVKNLFYGIISLPVVWHPLLWHTRARVAESRELVCDAMAAETVAGAQTVCTFRYCGWHPCSPPVHLSPPFTPSESSMPTRMPAYSKGEL